MLPTAVVVLIFGFQVLAIQTSRISLVSLAAEGARALGRGEDKSLVSALIAERARDALVKVEYLDLSVCLELSKNSRIVGMFEIPVIERACVRKSGL